MRKILLEMFMLPEGVDRSRVLSRPDRIFRALQALKGDRK